MSERSKNIWLIFSSILFVAACGFWLFAKIDAGGWSLKSISMSKQVVKSQKAYNHKLNHLKYEVEQNDLQSTNPKLRSLSLQNGSEQLVSTVGTTFFNGLCNWNSVQQYSQRKDKLKDITTNDLQNDKSLWGDKKTDEYIKVTGLSSHLDKAHFWIESADDKNIVAIATINFTSGFSGSPSGSVQRTYEMTYDKSQQKIAKLQLLQSSHEK